MIKTLYKNDWLELKEVKSPENGINGYVFSHEKRCNGKIISILPYRFVNGRIQYLLRNEVTPCWSLEPVTSSLTGGVEEFESGFWPPQTAQKELKEEAGYDSPVISLGNSYGSKSSDTIYYFFTADLTGLEPSEPEGDGSELEKSGFCYWVDDISKSVDPLTYVAFYRLHNQVFRKNTGRTVFRSAEALDSINVSQEGLFDVKQIPENVPAESRFPGERCLPRYKWDVNKKKCVEKIISELVRE